MKKIGWYGQEFSQSFLLTAHFLCLQVPPFLLLPWRKLEEKRKLLTPIQPWKCGYWGNPRRAKLCSYTPRWEDWWLDKMKFIIYMPPQKHFLTFTNTDTINLCAWGWGEHSGAVHVFRPAALQSHTDAPYGSAGFGGHLLIPVPFSCADFSTWGKSWFPWLMLVPY